MKTQTQLLVALCWALAANTAFAQKKAEPDVIDDGPEGITAEDTATLRRGRAQVSASKAKAAAFRSGNVSMIVGCEAMLSSKAENTKMCSTASGSLYVLPGATVNGNIVNAPNTEQKK